MQGNYTLNSIVLNFSSRTIDTLSSLERIKEACKSGNLDFKKESGLLDFDLGDVLLKYTPPSGMIKPQQKHYDDQEEFRKDFDSYLATLKIYSELKSLAHQYSECLVTLGFSRYDLGFLSCNTFQIDKEVVKLVDKDIYEVSKSIRFLWYAQKDCHEEDFQSTNYFCYPNYPIQIMLGNSNNLLTLVSDDGSVAWGRSEIMAIQQSVKKSGSWDFVLIGDGEINFSLILKCGIPNLKKIVEDKNYIQELYWLKYHGSKDHWNLKLLVDGFHNQHLNDNSTIIDNDDSTIIFNTCYAGALLTTHEGISSLLSQHQHVIATSKSFEGSATNYSNLQDTNINYTYPEVLDAFLLKLSDNIIVSSPILAGIAVKKERETTQNINKYIIDLKEFYSSFCHFGTYADCIKSFEEDILKFVSDNGLENYLVCLPEEINNTTTYSNTLENSYFIFGIN